MQYTKSPNALDPVEPRRIKCQGACGEYKAPDEFYVLKTRRASPYCIACNARAVNRARLRKELRTQGSEAFVARMHQKELQLDDMVAVLSTAQGGIV